MASPGRLGSEKKWPKHMFYVPHVSAIYMVRAAILRAAIGTIMSCLDPADRRGNRASVGEIVPQDKSTFMERCRRSRR